MKKASAIDLLFLLLENPSRPTHMSAYQIFEVPPGEEETFVPRLVDTLRGTPAGEPFNLRLKWLSKSVASWEEVTPDMHFHVRHLAVPKPGRLRELHEIVAFLNQPLLDRARPLWEYYVIDGLEKNRFAVFVKIHHALADGQTALKLIRNALGTTPDDRAIRALWQTPARGGRKPSGPARGLSLSQLASKIGGLPKNLMEITTGLTEVGAQALRLKPRASSALFDAPKTIYNRTAESSARRYAHCEIPLQAVRDVAAATESKVNDVVMTAIDHGLHRYLEEHGAAIRRPLVATMAMSLRSENNRDAAGNVAAVDLVPMGEPRAEILQRLRQIQRSTSGVKAKGSKLPASVRQLYSLVVFGASTLPDLSAAFRQFPNSNLVISNMAGPKEQLYLAGAPQVAFQGLPIVPPGCGLNVTFASVAGTICLAVGAAPEAVDDAERMVELIQDGFAQLQGAAKPKQAAPRKRTGGTRPAKKQAVTKKALKKKARRKKVVKKPATAGRKQ